MQILCWVLGDSVDDIFAVDADKSQTVAGLKLTIRDSKERGLETHPTSSLALYRVQISDEKLDTELGQMNQESLKAMKKLRPTHQLSRVFPDEPAEGSANVIVVYPNSKFWGFVL
jgi:hypothetical protein